MVLFRIGLLPIPLVDIHGKSIDLAINGVVFQPGVKAQQHWNLVVEESAGEVHSIVALFEDSEFEYILHGDVVVVEAEVHLYVSV